MTTLHGPDRTLAAPLALRAGAVLRSREAALALAGTLLMTAGIVFLLGVLTAEAVYPDVYTTHDNEISDLGATRPPDSIIRQPSARIFNATMLLTGAGILGGAVFLHRALAVRRATIVVALLGIGVFGVGVFPGNYGTVHPLFAMLAFVSGGLAPLLALPVERGAFRSMAIALGVAALAALAAGILGEATPLWDELGDGGVERWIAYPVVLWLVGFGGHLIGGPTIQAERARPGS